MSEYQYYEFRAIDRPLTERQMVELRALSTRATITPTRFTNVYHWGNFKGDPVAMVEEYFDAFLYVANWGSHQLMLRLPRQLLDLETAAAYCPGEGARAWAKGDYVILSLDSEDEEPEWDEGGDEWLPSLLPLREGIAGGDLRSLYLGWLLCAQTGELEDNAVEPPVPPELGSLSAPLKALADFLRIDGDLLAVAAEQSPGADDASASSGELAQGIRGLPEAEKDELLVRVAEGRAPHLRAELLRRFRRATPSDPNSEKRRTVAQLLAAAEQRAVARRRREAERQALERARRAQEQAAARAKYLDDLAGREEAIWNQVEGLIETKRPADYDRAVQFLMDLRDLAARTGQTDQFEPRLAALRDRHTRKPSLLERLGRARLGPAAARSRGSGADRPTPDQVVGE